MRRYLYFLSCDSEHMQKRLERLYIKQQLELTDLEGMFTASFEKSNRTDLEYLAVPYKNGHFPEPEHYTGYGWELMGRFNGIAVFKSLPCASPDRDRAIQRMKEDGCYHKDRTLPILLLIQCAVCLILFYAASKINWYMSYTGLAVHAASICSTILTFANILSLRSYLSAWLHGWIPNALFIGVIGILVISTLDDSADNLFFASFLLLVGAACFMGFWRRSRCVSVVSASVCAAVLIIGLAFPNISESANSHTLRSLAEERNAFVLSDFGWEETVNVAELEVDGTFLARRTEYCEIGEEHTVTTICYCCISSGMADHVEAYLNARSADNEKNVFLREGNIVCLVSCSENLTEQQIADLTAQLN